MIRLECETYFSFLSRQARVGQEEQEEGTTSGQWARCREDQKKEEADPATQLLCLHPDHQHTGTLETVKFMVCLGKALDISRWHHTSFSVANAFNLFSDRTSCKQSHRDSFLTACRWAGALWRGHFRAPRCHPWVHSIFPGGRSVIWLTVNNWARRWF